MVLSQILKFLVKNPAKIRNNENCKRFVNNKTNHCGKDLTLTLNLNLNVNNYFLE